jgi:hypothetical protein
MNYHAITNAILADIRPATFVPLPPDEWLNAYSETHDREIHTATPTNDLILSSFGHEAGHLATTPDGSPPALKWEFLATQWGLQAIKRHGGLVTPRMIDFQKYALLSYVESGFPMPPSPWRGMIRKFLTTGEF